MRWKLTLIATVVLSTPVWAKDLAGLSTAGRVWTNAVLLPSGSTLHPGDHVKTDRGSAAVISSPSTGRVEVRERSSVTLGDGGIVLHEGVVATSKASVELDGVEIVPHGARDTLIVIAKRDQQTLIAAHRGEATIRTNGFAPLLLPSGQYAVPAAVGSGQRDKPETNKAARKNDDEDDDDDDDGGGALPAGKASGSKKGGWKIGSLSHGKSVGLVAGIGAAAVGGTVAGFALLDESPSPSK